MLQSLYGIRLARHLVEPSIKVVDNVFMERKLFPLFPILLNGEIFREMKSVPHFLSIHSFSDSSSLQKMENQ